MIKKLLVFLFSFAFIFVICSCSSSIEQEHIDDVPENVYVPNEEPENKLESESEYEPEPQIIGISHSEAQEQSGFFIKKEDGSFASLDEEIVPLDYTKRRHLFMLSHKNEELSSLEQNENLVLFSPGNVKDVYYVVPVLEEGYTIPFVFSEYYKLESMDYKWSGADYDSYQADDIISRFGDYKDDCQIEFITANGLQPKEFYAQQTICLKDFCTSNGFGCSYDSIFVSNKYADKVVVDFYFGTQYYEETFLTDIKYFIIDGCEKVDYNKVTNNKYYSGTAITPEFTKEGYVVLDTSSLSNGKYVIANLNNRVIFEISR